MKYILLVEDDPILGESIKFTLEQSGYSVILNRSISDAKTSLNGTQPIHLILLDLGLPDGFGLNLIQEIKASQKTPPPVLILTAQGDEETAVHCLQKGALDYIRKPFGNRELLARIQNALQSQSPANSDLSIRNLQISFDNRRVFFHEQELPFNRREFDIFSVFAKRMDRVVSRENLIEHLDHGEEMSDRTIDSHISHIRSKIKRLGFSNLKIVSEYGIGYRMVLQ